MKNNILRKIIREVIHRHIILENQLSVFKDVTNIPDYDKLMDEKYSELPSHYEEMVADVRNIRPGEYISYCAKIQDTSFQDQLSYIRPDVVDRLKDLMEQGVKMDMPYINFVKGHISQEGRHRAKAAMDLGIDKIPVLFIEKKPVEAGTLSSKIGEWKDLSFKKNNYGVEYLISYDLNDYEQQKKMLESIHKNYYNYLLDQVIYEIRRGFRKNLIEAAKDEIYIMQDIEKDLDISMFYNKMPKGTVYNNELRTKIAYLAILYILDNNFYNLYGLIDISKDWIASVSIHKDYDLEGDYASAQDFLLDYGSLVFEDINIFSIEDDDYYKMSKEFIQDNIKYF